MTPSANQPEFRDQEKQIAARAGAELVETGNIVGLGSGSTAAYAIRFLAERVRSGLQIVGIPTSHQTKHLAEQLGIPLGTLEEHPQIAAWLSSELAQRVSVETARAIGETYQLFNALAQRDARQLSRLERLGAVPTSRIPLFTDDVSELAGLVRIAGLL